METSQSLSSTLEQDDDAADDTDGVLSRAWCGVVSGSAASSSSSSWTSSRVAGVSIWAGVWLRARDGDGAGDGDLAWDEGMKS